MRKYALPAVLVGVPVLLALLGPFFATGDTTVLVNLVADIAAGTLAPASEVGR